MKPLVMLASTRRVLRGFPKQVRIDFGTELRRVQEGLDPVNWKAMPSISVGAREIRVIYQGHWRLIYLAKFEEAIYILHALQKKTSKTTQSDIELAKQRLVEIMAERRRT